MKQTRQRSGEWVIACDGRKALILENVGDDKRNLRSDPPTHVQSREPCPLLGFRATSARRF